MVPADLLAVATEQEGGVVDRAIALDEVAANDEIHLMAPRRGAEALDHSVGGFRQERIRVSGVDADPLEQAESVFRKDE